jgi:hypothetical protein
LQGAEVHDVTMLCAHALAAVAPDCCEAHEDELRTEFLEMLRECVEMQEDNMAEGDEADDAPAQVH